jgi:flagellin-like protein
MNSKAISPMIATILLIAFTVAVGGIISVWLTGYTRTTSAAVSTATEDQIKCTGTYPDVYLVTNGSIIVRNPGSENISNIICFTSDGTPLPNQTISVLVPGNVSAITWTRSGNTSVTCSGLCRSIGVTGECRSDQSCWAAQ